VLELLRLEELLPSKVELELPLPVEPSPSPLRTEVVLEPVESLCSVLELRVLETLVLCTLALEMLPQERAV